MLMYSKPIYYCQSMAYVKLIFITGGLVFREEHQGHSKF